MLDLFLVNGVKLYTGALIKEHGGRSEKGRCENTWDTAVKGRFRRARERLSIFCADKRARGDDENRHYERMRRARGAHGKGKPAGRCGRGTLATPTCARAAIDAKAAKLGFTPPAGPPAATPAMAAKAGIPMLAPPPGRGYTLRSTMVLTRGTALFLESEVSVV